MHEIYSNAINYIILKDNTSSLMNLALSGKCFREVYQLVYSWTVFNIITVHTPESTNANGIKLNTDMYKPSDF